NLGVRRREDGVDRLELRRMNALLAIEAERLRDATGPFETRGVLETGIGAVHAAKSVGARGSDDGVHDGVPAMPGIDLIVRVTLADGRRWHTHRRGVVTCTEDDRLEPGRRFSNLSRVQITRSRLDLRFDPDASRVSRAALDLRQQHVHKD